MKFTKKQFDEIGPWHFNDLCFDSTNQTTMLKIFNLLPSHMQGQAISWGCDDTVFRDDVFEYLIENQFDMTVEEYYESEMFHYFIKKGQYQKISFKKLKPKVVQFDIETEGGTFMMYDDGVAHKVTMDGQFNLKTGIKELDKFMGGGFAKGELGIIMAPPYSHKTITLDEMIKRKKDRYA